MTRLALARTLVKGTVTLQGKSFTFSASGSGTGTADRVAEATKLAVTAANTAAIAAARASIDQILLNNSAVLSDLEITSLISNNLSTTVIVYRPLALSKIAKTTDGVNYTLIKDTVIGSRQWLTVPNGIRLTTGGNALDNNGFFQIGDSSSSVSTTLKSTTAMDYPPPGPYNNAGTVQVSSGVTCTIGSNGSGVSFNNTAEDAGINNSGIVNNYGAIHNNEQESFVLNAWGGVFNNYASIENSGPYAYVENSAGGTFNNTTGALVKSDPGPQDNNTPPYTVNYGTWDVTLGGTVSGMQCLSSCPDIYPPGPPPPSCPGC